MTTAELTRAAGSPSEYQEQRKRRSDITQRRREHTAFCEWIGEELGITLTPEHISTLVDDYERQRNPGQLELFEAGG